jgi:DNA-binding NtrC family response regulator
LGVLPKVLIVDDERAIVDSLYEIILSAGYDVSKAYSGEQAIAAAMDFCPNILLSDVLMPGLNGFEVALEIKKACPNCRLLLFSGQASTAAMAQRFGPTFTSRGYRFELLPKPYHPTALLKKLEDSLTHIG